jgi:plastocyanin
MQKSLVVVIAIIALALVAGIGTLMYIGRDKASENAALPIATQDATDSDPEALPEVSAAVSNDNHLKGANIGQTVDATSENAVTVEIADFSYKTTIVKVKKGTTVTWVNRGQVPHDVTSTTNSPKQGLSSDLLSNGEEYKHTFNETGVYQYFCSPHPTQMRGVVEVVE